MDLTTLTPAQIDEAWAPIASRAAEARSRSLSAQSRAERSTHQRSIDSLLADAAKYNDIYVAAKVEMDPFQAEWDRRDGWTRAYIVPGGHVHRHTYCHTLHVTTLISWLPEQSGKDEAEIVELAGERACTVCYPSAPVDVLKRATQLYTAEERRDNAAKAQRAAELAAKKADKAVKAIVDIDGRPLRDTGGYIVNTERSAEIDAVSHLHDVAAYGYEFKLEAFTRVAKALAAKRGQSVEEVTAFLTAKAEKKAAKTKREMAR